MFNNQAPTEPTVMGETFSVISGSTTIPSARQVPFMNFKPLTDGIRVDAKPDFYATGSALYSLLANLHAQMEHLEHNSLARFETS